MADREDEHSQSQHRQDQHGQGEHSQDMGMGEHASPGDASGGRSSEGFQSGEPQSGGFSAEGYSASYSAAGVSPAGSPAQESSFTQDSYSESSYSESSFSQPSSFSSEPQAGGEATSWEEASLPPWSDRTGERTQLVEPQDLPSGSPWASSAAASEFDSEPLQAREGASAILSQQSMQQNPSSQSLSPQGMSRQSSGMDDFFGSPQQAPGQAPGHASSQAPPARSDRNLVRAVITGAVLIVLAWSMFAIGKVATLVFTTIVLVVGIAEFYSALNKVRYNPASLIGYAATIGLCFGVYWKGTDAYPIVLGIAVMACLLWYLLGGTGGGQTGALPNISATFLGIIYVGVLGSFAALLLTFQDGVNLVVAAVIVSVAYDIGGWGVGRLAGRTPLAEVSPSKTVEGLIGGILIAFFAALLILTIFNMSPWVDPGTAGDRVFFALFASLIAPLGDLSQSMLKRNLGIKDMSGLLPGHGGVLDRFDTLLFVLPVCYFAARITGAAVVV